MTATERAKRSDALYYETASVTRRVLCDMIANREADLEDARAKNEELWASNERMGLKAMAAIGEVQEENERLRAENAKLRKLAWDMMRFFEDGDYCTVCEKVAECDAQEEYDDDCLMRGVFLARMRELGVEVDG